MNKNTQMQKAATNDKMKRYIYKQQQNSVLVRKKLKKFIKKSIHIRHTHNWIQFLKKKLNIQLSKHVLQMLCYKEKQVYSILQLL
jgi:hypothetical protein